MSQRKSCVHFFGAGKTMLGKKIHSLCYLFEVKGFRPTLVADAFSLGSFGGYIHKPLRAVGVRGDLGGFCPLYAFSKLRLVFLSVLRLCGCSMGVLLENCKDSGLVKVRPQLPSGDGLCSVRREIGQPPPALLNGNPIVLHESSGEILKGFLILTTPPGLTAASGLCRFQTWSVGVRYPRQAGQHFPCPV